MEEGKNKIITSKHPSCAVESIVTSQVFNILLGNTNICIIIGRPHKDPVKVEGTHANPFGWSPFSIHFKLSVSGTTGKVMPDVPALSCLPGATERFAKSLALGIHMAVVKTRGPWLTTKHEQNRLHITRKVNQGLELVLNHSHGLGCGSWHWTDRLTSRRSDGLVGWTDPSRRLHVAEGSVGRFQLQTDRQHIPLPGPSK